MTVGRDYMLKKTIGPSTPKYVFDTKVVPGLVNLAGGVEVALDRAAVRLGQRPAVLVAGAGGAVALLMAGLWRFGLQRS
ncbi:hypothetical protein DC429_09920 [Arthrobacter sp. TPD3018]|nr:hypothetical protein [Arthrobacter sp. TPD3018]PVE57791.1 hypothetical protein DC425_08090 [Sphingomonas sp. TPD3009]PVE58605.1 hypothetical protein DC429_09920 [Arthrobacter sp. TPD3018]PVE86127.1 hypothetical protein DC431_09910 [Sphingomonas melonis]